MGLVINLKADTGIVDRSENTIRFYRDIRDYKTFDKDEEIKWFTKLKEAREKMQSLEHSSDKKAYNQAKRDYEKIREYIILCNQRLVVASAKNYSTTETLTDYINEINFGLMEAIDRFDVTKGVKFASYAMWYIIRAINAFKYGDCEMVHKTNHCKTFHVISKAKNKFMQIYEREPSTDELLDILNDVYNKNIEDKNDLLDINYTSIDNDVTNDDEGHYSGDLLSFHRSSASYNDCEAEQEQEFNTNLLSSLLVILPPREKQILQMRFGLYNDNGLHKEYKITEIAEEVGLTPERVRQLENDALKKLKEEYKTRISKL